MPAEAPSGAFVLRPPKQHAGGDEGGPNPMPAEAPSGAFVHRPPKQHAGGGEGGPNPLTSCCTRGFDWP